jgi:viroplasmin and RNaseH domain-containing protein
MPDYYVVAHGRETGVYTTWGEASKSVNEFSNAVHKKFKCLDAAMQYARAYGGKAVLRSYYTGPNTYPSTCNTTKKKKAEDSDDDDVQELAQILSRVLLSARKAKR